MRDSGTIGMLLLFVSLTLWNLSSASARGYDQSCDLTASVAHIFLGTYEPTATCETEKGLFCIPFIGKCGCYMPGSMYIDDKCRARVNMPCFGADSTKVDCVLNAKCTNETFNYCKCDEGYNANDEGTACIAQEKHIHRNHNHHSENRKENSIETSAEEKSFEAESKQTYAVGSSASNSVSIFSVFIFFTGAIYFF